jgi:hypothetical protein
MARLVTGEAIVRGIKPSLIEMKSLTVAMHYRKELRIGKMIHPSRHTRRENPSHI